MLYAKKLLDKIFNDNVERTILGNTNYPDIIYKEVTECGEVYKILNVSEDKDCLLCGGIDLYATSKEEYEEKRKEDWYFTNSIDSKYNDLYQLINSEYSDIEDPIEELTKATYDIEEIDNSKLVFIEKIHWGHAFDRDYKKLYLCKNLHSLAIWHEFINDLDDNITRLKKLSNLSLSKLRDTKLPLTFLDSIHKLQNLTNLTMNSFLHCKLKEVPKSLSELKNLKYLNLNDNKLSNFEEISKIISLKELKLSANQYKSIDGIKNLLSLEYLDLSNNQLTNLPEELINLKNLKVLNISKNPLQKLPIWLFEMISLEELNIEQTQISTIDKSIVTMKNLKKINLKKNPIISLPKELSKLPKKLIELEIVYKSLYDKKIKEKISNIDLEKEYLFQSDINFKLIIIQKLMYDDEVLLPKFDLYKLTKKSNINLKNSCFIKEAMDYFINLPIPMKLLIDIKELDQNGGDDIYFQVVEQWDGEDSFFDVNNINDVEILPNLKRINSLFFNKEQIKYLRSKKIKVSMY